MTERIEEDWTFYGGLFLRFAVVVTVLLGAVYFANSVKDAIGFEVMPHNEAWMHKMILLGLLAYIVLTALPFVPGAEIGMTLLTVFGAQMAPLIYLATLISLSLAYGAGRLISLESSAETLRNLRLSRMAAFIEKLAVTPRKERTTLVLESTGHPALRKLARFRYVAFALLINIPGNSIIGGGGGLSFLAGISGVFAFPAYFLTIAIAVLPIPLMVFLFGV